MQREITFGDWLKRRRKSLGITQKSLAERTHCSAETIYKIEAGRRRPSLQIAKLLRQELGIDAGDQEAFIQFARATKPFQINGRSSPQTPWRTHFIPDSNLPTQLDSLIGREQIVTHAHRLLKKDDVRLITLVGSPGIGKTRVAIKLGETAILDYPNGVYFVPLTATHKTDQIASTIAQSLGIVISGRKDSLDSLKQSLFERQMLLILDNFEQLLDGAYIVRDLLMGCPLLKIVVTSRSPLRIRGERQLPVEPLALPGYLSTHYDARIGSYPAVQLFVERATAVIPTFELTSQNAFAVAEICARLDGVPLAIEIVAARLRLLQPQEILERLTGQEILTSRGAVDMDERHHTLGTAIAWSVDLLNAAEREFFCRLGVFVNGFTLDAAQFVAEPQENALDLLSALVDMSLLKRDPEKSADLRFITLVTIREFALVELNKTTQLDAVLQRHANYYLQFAQKMEPRLHSGKPAETLAELSAEHDNLLAALDYFIDKRAWLQALQLAGALGEYWVYHNHSVLALRYASDLIAATDGLPLEVARGKLLGRAAMAADFAGNNALASHYARQAMQLAVASQNQAEIAFAYLGIVMSHHEVEEDEKLLGWLEQGFAAARESQQPWLTASLLNACGCVERAKQRYDSALSYYEKSLELSTEIGYEWLMSINSHNIGAVTRRQEQHQVALTNFQQSLELSFDLGDERSVARTLQTIAGVYIGEGKLEVATQMLSFVQSLNSRRNVDVEGSDFIHFERLLTTLRQKFAGSAFDNAWQIGQLLTASQIMQLVQNDS